MSEIELPTSAYRFPIYATGVSGNRNHLIVITISHMYYVVTRIFMLLFNPSECEIFKLYFIHFIIVGEGNWGYRLIILDCIIFINKTLN